MAQHDYSIENQAGAGFRADLNNALAAIASQNSGATAPNTTFPFQWWADTTTGLLKIRSAANDAWITLGPLAGLGIQSGGQTYALDTGTANTYQVAYMPAIADFTDGMVLRFKAKTANTGASTFNGYQILGADHAALTGGEIVANGDVWVQWNSSLNGGSGAMVLVDSTGGELPVAAATKANHAIRFDQALGLGQTWQNMTGSRALSTTYTNSTGKPIMVSVKGAVNSGANVILTVGGLAISQQGNTTTSAETLTVCGIVPPGATYQVQMESGSISAWSELR